MSDLQSSSDPSPTFTRRKFTLPERLDAELQQLAKQYYRNNVSLCIRGAVEDHKRTLEGEGRIALKRLERNTVHLEEGLVELDNDISAIVKELEERRTGRSRTTPPSIVAKEFDDAQQVLNELHDAATSLRIDDLTERLELSPRRVTHALEQLLDGGSVIESSNGARYHPITMQSNNPDYQTQ